MMRFAPLAFVLLLAACAGAPSRGADSSSGCPEGGVPDDGDLEGCEIRVGACCYLEQRYACAAAGCVAGRCVVLESYPGQIACDP